MVLMNQDGAALPGISIIDPQLKVDAEPWPTAVPVWVGLHKMVGCTDIVWVPVSSWEDYFKQESDKPWFGVCESVRLYFINGGVRGYVMLLPAPESSSDLNIEAKVCWLESQLGQTGVWDHAVHEDQVSLITLPLLREWLEPSPWVISTLGTKGTQQSLSSEIARNYVRIWAAVMRATTARSDWFFVLDTPFEQDAINACIELLHVSLPWGARGGYVALYGPHIELEQELELELAFGKRYAPPSGAVCGVMARVDAAQGIWKAPANELVVGARGLVCREGMRGASVVKGGLVNLMRNMPGHRGEVKVWGCRTLASRAQSRDHYVQVRRTTTWIERQLRAICRFAVFEPNTLLTWLRIRTSCEAWLRRLWEEGGLMGAEESQAFVVQIGHGETMTAAEVAAGVIRVSVGLALLQAAEFIEVHLTLRHDQSVTSSLQREYQSSEVEQ
ncbi:phage tail sheath family protein [Pseudomonas synxantha]|uniref:Phage tail sheath protein FI n=1 Tax=Pseudomonas synxantha TaxID=47883 RepID=A0AAU8TZU1_9PSED|nr:phage tail sheath family protein [Pseudomonas synxantha]AKA86364.1 Phage tail sheath protein FI [Pseudomonas synxantha]